MAEEPKWRSLDGKLRTYGELSDDHLKNIIRDGYRNPHIIAEAARRGFEVPVRPVDELTPYELMAWVEAFASTSLAGNKFAGDMVRRWRDDKPAFMVFLNEIIINHQKNGEDGHRQANQ